MRSIIIKPADKGGAVVILDRDYYINKGLRQLSDPLSYMEVEEHHSTIVQIWDEMLMRQEIDISCYTYLVSNKISTAQFYMLPKIHKNKTNPPGRPIVSGNGCPTERISSFVDFFLQPLIIKGHTILHKR